VGTTDGKILGAIGKDAVGVFDGRLLELEGGCMVP